MAVAVDRRDGPAVIEDRPDGRPRRSSPWPWPITPSRRAASPATTASRSESHRRGGLDTVRQWAWERPWAAATHGGRGRRGWRKRHRGVDPSGVIRVHTLTEATGDDATLALDRLTAVKGPLARVTADAASDTVAIDETARARGATVVVPTGQAGDRRWPRLADARTGSNDPVGQDARPVPLEAGVRVPSSGPDGEHVLPRHVHHRRGPSRPESSQAGECGRPRLCDPESDDRPRPTRVISPRPMRILSVGIVRTRHDACTTAAARRWLLTDPMARSPPWPRDR